MPPSTMIDNAEERIRAVEERLNFVFSNKQFLLNALDATDTTKHSESREAFTIVGADVLTLILYDHVYQNHGSAEDMVVAKVTLGSADNLAKIGFLLGLDTYIQLDPALEAVVPAKVMAGTVETIVGAAYRDSGGLYSATHSLVLHMGILPRS